MRPALRPFFSHGISVVPEPPNVSSTTSPPLLLLNSGYSTRATGFIVGCSALRLGGIVNLGWWDAEECLTNRIADIGSQKEIIAHAVWLYFRFGVSFRDVEDMMAARGALVTRRGRAAW